MKKQLNMTEGPLFGPILLYTLPIICTNLLQLTFNAADLIVVGRFCGSLCVAAVGATSSLVCLIIYLFIGLSVGVGVKAAYYAGSHNDENLQKVVRTAFPTAAVCGIFITLVGYFGCTTFLTWMGTPEDVLPLSRTYLRIYFFGAIGSMVYNYGASLLRAMGDTKSPLIFLTLSGILNVALNLLFVLRFSMSVDGVAYATIISQYLSAVLVVFALHRRTDAAKLTLHTCRIYGPILKQILYIGIPAGLQSCAFSLSNVLIQSSVNSFGSVVVSGNSAASSIQDFVYQSVNAFQQTSVNFISQNFGAQKFDRIKKIFIQTILCVSVLAVVLGHLVYLFGRPLLSIYIADSPEAIEYGMLRFRIILLTYLFGAVMDCSTGGIRGLNMAILPLITSLIGSCAFRVIWLLTIFKIPKFHTLSCIYVSYPITWIITCIAQIICFFILWNRFQKDARKKATPIS